MGILGFLYPMDTHSISGGMRALAVSLESSIKKNGGELLFRNPCLKVVRTAKGYEVHTKKGVYLAKKLVCNISPEVFQSLIGDKSIKQDKGKMWGALVAYFSFKSERTIDALYHQIHDVDGSLFFSFSQENGEHSLNEYQRITVSSHISVNEFSDKDEDYQKIKDEFKSRVLEAFEKHFSEYGIKSVKFDSVGTPLTFNYYTRRPHGEVGGLIHTSVLSLRRLMPNRLKDEPLYFVGDYSFPGQGIVSVFQSALNSVK